LYAEVIALRVTVASLRADLDGALAGAPLVTLDLPLVRLALSREVEPALTRDMARALAAPDRGLDSANVRIVMAERALAAHIAAASESFRRSA